MTGFAAGMASAGVLLEGVDPSPTAGISQGVWGFEPHWDEVHN